MRLYLGKAVSFQDTVISSLPPLPSHHPLPSSSFLYSDEIYPPNFFSSSETKGSLLWALEGTAFILLWVGPCTWGEEILASQSKLCITCVSGTWEPQIHCPDGPGPAFTAYMDPWVHLPEGLYSHWLCAGGLVKGQLRMCGVGVGYVTAWLSLVGLLMRDGTGRGKKEADCWPGLRWCFPKTPSSREGLQVVVQEL